MADENRMASRSASLRLHGGPATLDEAARAVTFVAATERAVDVFDWDTWSSIPEVLLMSGVHLPESGQVPMLDTHEYGGVSSVLGSFRDFTVQDAELVGRAVFSRVGEAEAAFVRVKEGHLTDVSVGYRVNAFVRIEEGQTATVQGREYSGPLRVVTDWNLFEVSLCPIGADSAAKARQFFKERNMSKYDESKRAARPGKRADAVCNFLQAEDSLCTLTGGPVCTWLTSEGKCGKPANEPRNPDPQDPATVGGTEDPTDGGRPDAPDAVPSSVPASGAEEGRAAALAERRRIAELETLCRAHNMPDETLRGFVDGGTSLDAARAVVLERLQARGAAVSFNRLDMGARESDKVRAAARDSLLIRCGVNLERPVPGAREMASMSMRELARDFLFRSGQSTTGDVKTLMGRALTTTDLPAALTETARKVLEDAFEKADHTWDIWAGTGSLSDFKQSHAVGVDFETTLRRLEEDGEYTYAYANERGEVVQLASYGRIYPISRQALINDDLEVFTDMAAVRGRAAANTINDLAYRALISNPVMSDGKNLFDAAHKNLFKGGGIPDVTKIGAVLTAMKMQKNASGEYLRINPRFFLGPVALETGSEIFFSSQFIGTQAQPNVTNLYAGNRFTRAYDPLLDDADPSAWYLLGPKGTSVKVYFLSGANAPRMEEKQGWTVDGVEFKVSIDAAAAPVSWLGVAKSSESGK